MGSTVFDLSAMSEIIIAMLLKKNMTQPRYP